MARHAAALDDRLGRLPLASDPAMLVVTVAHEGRRAGCLVGFHAQSSIEPWRYCVFLSKANHTYRVARRAEHLLVHFLAPGAGALAAVFGARTEDDGIDKFATVGWRPGPDGATPLLDGVDTWLFGRVVARQHALGDHAAFVLEAVDADVPERAATLRYHAVQDLRPGHPA